MSDVDVEWLTRSLECLLVSRQEPVELEVLASVANDQCIEHAVKRLNEYWVPRGKVISVKSGYLLFEATQEVREAFEKSGGERGRKLSKAAVETLCYIAINQPVTLKDIEDARGLKLFRGIFDALLDAGYVRTSVRKSDSGRALTYVTTDLLLEYFGLSAVSDLPTREELAELLLSRQD